jgi:uncharacterized membrane protein YhdT
MAAPWKRALGVALGIAVGWLLLPHFIEATAGVPTWFVTGLLFMILLMVLVANEYVKRRRGG